MIEIDLNDTVSVELTEWGAAYLNATNIFKEITTTQKYITQNCLSNQFNTYEEALEAGIQEALKLI